MAHQQLTDIEPRNEVGQRCQIEALNAEGYTQTGIARVLKWSPITIHKELARNSDTKGYKGSLAVKRMDRRRREEPRRRASWICQCRAMIGSVRNSVSFC